MLTFSPRAEIVPRDGDCVRFLALEGQRWIPCAITRDALEYLSGSPLPQPEQLLGIYRQERERICALADRKYASGRINRVLLTSEDLRAA